MTKKFQRGDLVKLTEEHDLTAKAGMRGKIVRLNNGYPLLTITDKTFVGHGKDSKQWYVPVSKLQRIRKASSVKAKTGKSVKRAASRPTVSTL